jgi:F-type H+-transporting ATPase subunit delta
MDAALQAASRGALRQLRADLPRVLASAGSDPAVLDEVANSLFGVVDVLDEQPTLRRVLVDPARDVSDRVTLVAGLFGPRLHPLAMEVVDRAVRSEWSHPRDLTDALEEAAVLLLAAAADQQGHLDDVEDELFRFARLVAARPDLRSALTDPALPDERKAGLVTQLLSGQVTEPTLTLVRRAVTRPRLPALEAVLEHFSALVASWRERLVVRVRSAITLSAEQDHRLRQRLTELYGREVSLSVEVDPRVLGGLEVQVGDEVLDGTIAARLEQARQRLTGGG